ncbi:MAG: TonB-dependent receptor [Rhodoferax sp.]|nr:TonB-dependent receptor [Rhodoferax sp.]
MKFPHYTQCFTAVSMALASVTALAADNATTFGDLSLEDLMQVEVTSVSKKPQRLANVAAAVHVISAEDIRLSGANSLPEVLRLAPGIDATRFSGNRWAVSARGFADVFAEKLLVMVDGRSAFNPAFSGVSWQDFLFPLEDIERIEVIRGPAASIWGSNGMNGVINIITKSAAATQGLQAVVGDGTVEGGYGRVRWGGQNADGNMFYRFYASTQRANEQGAPPSLGGGRGHDAYGHDAAGFRIDGYLANDARWDLSGDFFQNDSNDTAYMYQGSGASIDQQTERHRGTTLRGRYEKTLADGGNLQFQSAYAHTDLSIPYAFTDQRDTFDLDIQHRFRVGERQDLIWGANYRVSSDTIIPGLAMSMNNPSRQMTYLGLFAQDEISLAESLRLTLGMRADQNPISGWDSQPTARLSWNLQPSQTLWGALSRTARAPSRADSGFNLNYNYIAGNLASYVPNTLVVLRSDDTQESEKLTAAEIGLRSQWASTLSTDFVAFRHHYENLLRTNGSTTIIQGFPLTVVDVQVKNGGEMTLDGLELTTDWRFDPAWRVQLAQTWNHVENVGAVTVQASGTVPDSITSLRLSWTPRSDINVDAWLRHTTARPGVPNQTQLQRQAFSEVDLRLAWRPKKGLELTLTGQNLNNGACDAYSGLVTVASNANVIPTCQPRSLIGQLRLDF